MRYETGLTPEETELIARLVEMDLRGEEKLRQMDVQRVLEEGYSQTNSSLWRQAAYGSEVQFGRIFRAVRQVRAERDTLAE
jgi:hypothetical protein